MKANSLSVILLFVSILTLFSCTDDKYKQELEITKSKLKECESRPNNENFIPFDLCNNPCAIDDTKYYEYNTDLAAAFYTIPYPEKGVLKKISQSNNIINYECIGGDYTSSKIQYKPEIIGNLSKISGSKLTIIVNYKKFKCDSQMFIDKKKKSVIQGQPIVRVKCMFIN